MKTDEGARTLTRDLTFKDNKIRCINLVTKPMKLKAGFMGSYPFTGTKIS